MHLLCSKQYCNGCMQHATLVNSISFPPIALEWQVTVIDVGKWQWWWERRVGAVFKRQHPIHNIFICSILIKWIYKKRWIKANDARDGLQLRLWSLESLGFRPVSITIFSWYRCYPIVSLSQLWVICSYIFNVYILLSADHSYNVTVNVSISTQFIMQKSTIVDISWRAGTTNNRMSIVQCFAKETTSNTITKV